MNSTKLSMTVQIPSGFGMPMGGHAFGATTPASDVWSAATTLVVRERADIAATTGTAKRDLGLAQSYAPGTSAWRPPTC